MSARRATGLLTRGSLPHRLPGPKPSDVVVGKHLPLQRRDRPGLAPEFPYRSPVWSATLAWRSVMTSVALDLDAVLADTRPLWHDWLEDAARRARVDLDVPDDREAAAAAARREPRRLAAAARALRGRSRPAPLPAPRRDERLAAAPRRRRGADRRLHRRPARARGHRSRARRRGAARRRRRDARRGAARARRGRRDRADARRARDARCRLTSTAASSTGGTRRMSAGGPDGRLRSWRSPDCRGRHACSSSAPGRASSRAFSSNALGTSPRSSRTRACAVCSARCAPPPVSPTVPQRAFRLRTARSTPSSWRRHSTTSTGSTRSPRSRASCVPAARSCSCGICRPDRSSRRSQRSSGCSPSAAPAAARSATTRWTSTTFATRRTRGATHSTRAPFEELREERLANEQLTDADGLVALLASMGWVSELLDADRDALLGDVRALLTAPAYRRPWETRVTWTRLLQSHHGTV